MKKLSEIIHREVSQGRRDFLTFSSMSLIGLAAGTVFPAPVKAAIAVLNSGNFAELDGINFYVMASNQPVVDSNRVNFVQETDEAQYLAQVMFQELMKFEFQYQNSSLSEALGPGMKPNNNVLTMSDGINSVNAIYSSNRRYFTDNMVEYVSGLLQNSYSKQTNVTVADRKLYNSWDMVKVNANIKQAEKGTQFKEIIDQLYSVATHYCQSGKLTGYKAAGENWARQLIEHYSKNEVLEELISSFKVQEYLGSGSSFEKAMWQVYNTINKVRALNISSGRRITEDELKKFERTLAGSVYSGFAMNMSWGQQSEKYTVLANRRNFDDVVTLLRNESGTQRTFWNSFFNQNSPDSFWNELNNMSLRTSTLQDEGARQRILQRYPALAGTAGSMAPTAFSGVAPAAFPIDSFLSVFTLLLGVGNFTWLTATDREEWSNPVPLMELGAALFDVTLNLIQLGRFLDKVTMFIYGNGEGIINSIAINMGKFSQFLSNLTAKGQHLTNVLERQIASKMFLATQNITRIINICFVGLAALGAALAAYNLYQAVEGGDIGDIIFAAINMLVATVALGVAVASFMGFAIAGPLGIIVAVIGIVVAIAQWIYTLLKKEEVKPTPIARYTNEYIKPKGLEYEDLGAYICRVSSYWKRTLVCAFDARTMNTDWDYVPSIADHDNPIYTQPGALVTSPRNGRIYNFANIQKPGYGNISNFFTAGATTPISNWRPGSDLQTCLHAVESQANNNSRAAIFVVLGNNSSFSRAFLTSHLEDAPTNSNELTSQLNLEWQEYPLDVVAINGLDETMFLIFTTRHIYQVKGGLARRIISDFVGQRDAPITYGLNALALGTNVNLIYRLNGLQAPDTRYHYLLTRDDNGDYTSMKLLRTINNPMSSDSPIVGRLFKKTNDLVSRMDFMYHDGKSGYARYGAIMNKTDDASLSLYNGVEFQVPDNGFRSFYKNAFIPK
ncbi:TPA: hypothetical protein RQN11_004143 [Aeromonas dhakensis]|uniref:hypothetical protein n=1 Tax=Aeromonas dhakensis TaxID=196024 RepID=UPI00288DBDD1|nr:hypothetical protein [Aeromonas dhakensis]